MVEDSEAREAFDGTVTRAGVRCSFERRVYRSLPSRDRHHLFFKVTLRFGRSNSSFAG